RNPIPFHQPFQLQVLGKVYHDDELRQFGQVFLNQKWNVQNDGAFLFRLLVPSHFFLHVFDNQRMKNAVQFIPSCFILKHDVPKGSPVQIAVCCNHLISEGFPHLANAFGTGHHHSPCRLIGVDNRRPPLSQHAGHSAFSSGDPASQTHPHRRPLLCCSLCSSSLASGTQMSTSSRHHPAFDRFATAGTGFAPAPVHL